MGYIPPQAAVLKSASQLSPADLARIKREPQERAGVETEILSGYYVPAELEQSVIDMREEDGDAESKKADPLDVLRVK